MGDRDAPSQHRSSDVVLAFVTGTFLAITLLGYTFMVEAHLTSGALPFFAIVGSWLVGFLAGLHLKSTPWRFLLVALVGVSAYYVARLLVWQFPYNLALLPAIAGCAALSGLSAGNFFPCAQGRFPRVKYLLLYENNGFLLGLALALMGSTLSGGWFLNFAPGIGVLPVAATVLYQRYAASRTSSAGIEVVTAPLLVASDHMFPLFVSGLHFGILLTSLFLTIQVFVSASFVALLAVGLAWIVGIIGNLNIAMPRSLSSAMGISIICYYVLLMVTSVFTPYEFLFPVFSIFVVLAALPAGAFVREYASKYSSSSTFLHQNNGFVVGYVLSLFGFAQWGVNFLYWAPLLSYASAFLGQSRRSFPAYTCMLIVAYLCIEMDSPGTFWPLVAAAGIGGACFFWRQGTSLSLSRSGDEGTSTGTRTTGVGGRPDQLPAWAGKAVLFIAGLAAIVLYYFVSRDFSSLLGPGEMSYLLVTAAYLTGLSVGYGLARLLPLAVVKALGPIALFAHLVLALFTKVVAGALISRGYGFEVLLGLLLVTTFCTSAFFALLVPKLADHMESGSVVSAYSWTLAGIVSGIGALIALLDCSPDMLWPTYFLALLALGLILLRRTGWMVPALVVGAFSIGLFTNHQDDLLRYAAEDYHAARGYENPRAIFQGSSFHHCVEVIETFQDTDQETPGSRIALLDGVESFRSDVPAAAEPESPAPPSTRLTYYSATLPAKYLSEKKGARLRVLILGGGPSDAAFRLREYAARTTLVEIDRLVAKSARLHWSHVIRHEALDDLEVVVDDPPHYLKTVPEKFDLIINQSRPLDDLSTALLHGRPFYELARSRLEAGGIFVESTRRRPSAGSHDDLAMRILRGVADTFDGYSVVETQESSAGHGGGYIYASDSVDFSTEELTRLMQQDGLHDGTTVHHPGCEHFRLFKVAALSWSNMDALLESSRWMEQGVMAASSAASGPEERTRDDSVEPTGFFTSLSENSRLVRAIATKVKEPRFAVLVAAVLVVAAVAKLLAWWSVNRKAGPTFVIQSDRPRKRRRRRKKTAHKTTVHRV